MTRVIYCAGEQGRVALDIFRSMGNTDDVVFADDNPSLHDTVMNGIDVIGGLGDIEAMSADAVQFVVAFGDKQETRLQIAGKIAAQGYSFCNAIHPSATLSDSTTLGSGLIVNAHTYIGPNADIRDHVLVDSCVNISHDAVLEEGVTITPHATLSGGTTLESDVYIGPDATIAEDVTIGTGAVVGAGAVVLDDVPPDTTVVGSPAEPLK